MRGGGDEDEEEEVATRELQLLQEGPCIKTERESEEIVASRCNICPFALLGSQQYNL